MSLRTSHGRAVSTTLALVLLAGACSGAKKPNASPKVSAGDSTTTTATGAGASDDAPSTTAAPGAPTPTTKSGSRSATKSGSSTATGGGTSPSGVALSPAGDPLLFSGALNTRGITANQLTICGHAALIFGPAFNASAQDFNVYYDAINDAGGVFGRKIVATYEDDTYDPARAVQAADACKAKNPFIILGGIGFDQIPSVRNWAENNKELYAYHIATEKGTAGKQYSFTTQPTVEQVGTSFGELAAARWRTKKFGVLYRNSEFWQPGFDAFKAIAAKRGINIVKAIPVEKNQGNYTQEISALKSAGAEVVFGWENTIALTAMVKQAKQQDYSPQWLAFPFNLTSQGLDDGQGGNDSLTPPMVGLSTWPGYSKGDYTGTFASYADDMKEFERQYAKYRPTTDIGGVAGDLLWLNWVEQKRFVEMLRACGKDCTRNHFAGLMVNGYKATTSPTCPLDFSTGSGHNGSQGLVNVLETYRSTVGDRKVNWRTISLCRTTNF